MTGTRPVTRGAIESHTHPHPHAHLCCVLEVAALLRPRCLPPAARRLVEELNGRHGEAPLPTKVRCHRSKVDAVVRFVPRLDVVSTIGCTARVVVVCIEKGRESAALLGCCRCMQPLGPLWVFLPHIHHTGELEKTSIEFRPYVVASRSKLI